MAAQSAATTVWKGGLARGTGSTSVASGTFTPVSVTWASRTARSAGKTSPEELLAAAHASCYCMQLSHELGEAGTPPDELTATATVEFEPGEGVRSSHIVVSGRVAGIDQGTFAAAAASAGESCPISGTLSLRVTVDATLES